MATAFSDYKVKDMSLAEWGRKEIDIAETEMPGLMALRAEFGKAKPLNGARIAGCLHMTIQTAVLIETLIALGADGALVVVQHLLDPGPGGRRHRRRRHPGVRLEGHERGRVLVVHRADHRAARTAGTPNMILDDGGDLTVLMHDKYPQLMEEVRGISRGDHDRRRTGSMRWRARTRSRCPRSTSTTRVTKSKFDNLYGCRESLVDGIKRATDVMMAGKVAVVAGFGDVGKGSAASLRSQGARVMVTEVDPICALQAAMEGYQVTTMEDAAPLGDIFVTATGNVDVITLDHMRADEAPRHRLQHRPLRQRDPDRRPCGTTSGTM